jgi:hypothetical protein
MEATGNELTWRKARASAAQNGCVEVANGNTVTHVRDSKSPERGMLTIDRAAFGVLLASVRRGELDL